MKDHLRPSYSLSEIVDLLGGVVVGDANVKVSQVATLDQAGNDNLAFFANERYLTQLQSTRAGAVILGKRWQLHTSLSCIVADNPYAYFARVSSLFNPIVINYGIHPTAVIHDSAKINPQVFIGPHVVIEAGAILGKGCQVGAGSYIGASVSLGDDCIIYPRVTIYAGCSLDDRVIIHSGVVIGADGFGIALDGGQWVKVPQIGKVRIGCDVEIGANSTVDRGALDDTVIEDGVKIDNHVQIAHNVHIGAHSALAAFVGIAGSTKIGKLCRIGGAAGVSGHLNIVDNVEVSAHTTIIKSILKPGTYTGVYPFESNEHWRKNAAHLRHLGDLAKRVKLLEANLELIGKVSS